MQAIVFTDRLNRGLSHVSRIVSSKNQLPILGNVLLSAEKGELLLTTTNLETAITTKIAAAVEKEGKITVPVKQFGEIAALLKEEKVKLTVKENNFFIEGEKTKNSLSTAPAEEFPPVTKKGKGEEVVIKKEEFKEAVEQIAIATSQDESRPVLGGVRIMKKGAYLETAATDGYRLTVKEIKTEKNEIGKERIIPVRTLLEVARVATEEKAKEVKTLVLTEQNQAVFLFEETEIISRLIEGDFPNYQKIIPEMVKTKATIEREEILDAVKLAAVFARESANIVKIKINKKNLTLSANAPSVGENSASLTIEQEGEDVEVAFNYRFLLEFLSTVQGERIVFETGGALNPGVFKIEKDSSLLHIIMPVRVQG